MPLPGAGGHFLFPAILLLAESAFYSLLFDRVLFYWIRFPRGGYFLFYSKKKVTKESAVRGAQTFFANECIREKAAPEEKRVG